MSTHEELLRTLIQPRHPHRHLMSRRSFIASAAGATAVALTSPIWMSDVAYADAPGTGMPKQLPHVTPGPFGTPLHFFFPGPADSTTPNVGHDPAVITDFNGFIGVADVTGMAVGTNTATGAKTPYTYHTDSRFMLGEFVGTDGRTHRGAFAFIWLDTTSGQFGPHSYDPTGANPTVPFWVTAIPIEDVTVELGRGTAVMDIHNVALTDWFTVPNSLNPAHPLGSAAATVDLKIEWSGVTRRLTEADSANHFAGLFLQNKAVVTATARTPSAHFQLVTNPASTVTAFAEIGHEQNGSFFG